MDARPRFVGPLAVLVAAALVPAFATGAAAGKRKKTRTPSPTPVVTPAPTPVATPPSSTTGTLLTDGFESFPSGQVWSDGATYGAWTSTYNGYGTTSIVTSGTKTLGQQPKASTSSGETHASLAVSKPLSGNLDLTMRAQTVKQLRTGSAPNPWEVAWVVWNFTSDQYFYYFVPKPNGWELGKVDATKKDPAGPACLWPSYANCVYPGAQRYLATGSAPTFPVGPWYTVRVTQVSNAITVYVNGAKVTSFVDSVRPYTSGRIGLYNEDAKVLFDDVRVTRP